MQAVDSKNYDPSDHQQKPEKNKDSADVMHTANPASRRPAKPPLLEVVLKAGRVW